LKIYKLLAVLHNQAYQKVVLAAATADNRYGSSTITSLTKKRKGNKNSLASL